MRFKTRAAAAAFVLAAGAAFASGAWAAQPALTNAAFFDADASGSNISGSGGQVTRGGWSTVLDQQNVSGNYGAEFFLSTVANPTAAQFLTPAAALSAGLSNGANTFYFFADSDDLAGGTAGFGLNLFLNGASQANPSISAFVVPGQAAVVDGSTVCTEGYAFTCVAGANTFTFTSGTTTVTLTDFTVTARGSGGGSTVDLVNSDNTQAFQPPAHSNGVFDTYGSFTLDVTTQQAPGVPEPASWALMIAGFGLAGVALRGRRRVAEIGLR